MTKFAPAKNSKRIVASASLSAMFAIVGGLGYNQQIANSAALNAQILSAAAPIEIPAKVASTTQVAQAGPTTVKKTKKTAKKVIQAGTTPVVNVAPVVVAPAPAAPVVNVAPVVVAPAPAAPAQAKTGGSSSKP